MYKFRISNYNDTVLDSETAELFSMRLEEQSRAVMPVLWQITDRMREKTGNGEYSKKRVVRRRILGIVLLLLGIVVFVPGLMEPKNLLFIITGAAAILVGVFGLLLAQREKEACDRECPENRKTRVTGSCRKAADMMLQGRRSVDWDKIDAQLSFDDQGMRIKVDTTEQEVPYKEMNGLYETEHLWLLVYSKKNAFLLQKKDITCGEEGSFASFVKGKMHVTCP